MGAGEIDVQKKRLLRFAFQEFHCAIGDVLVGERCQSDAFAQFGFFIFILEDPVAIARDQAVFAAAHQLIPFPSSAPATEQAARLVVSTRGR